MCLPFLRHSTVVSRTQKMNETQVSGQTKGGSIVLPVVEESRARVASGRLSRSRTRCLQLGDRKRLQEGVAMETEIR